MHKLNYIERSHKWGTLLGAQDGSMYTTQTSIGVIVVMAWTRHGVERAKTVQNIKAAVRSGSEEHGSFWLLRQLA